MPSHVPLAAAAPTVSRESAAGALVHAWEGIVTEVGEPSSASVGAWMAGLADRLSDVAPRWDELVDEAVVGRACLRVLTTKWFDAWLLAWPLGVTTEWHDHGGAAGAFRVVSGELLELSPRRSGRCSSRLVEPGRTAVFGPQHIHDVVNPRPAPATSVHVYWPPISSMTFFERIAGGALRRCRVELVEDEPLVTLA